MSLAGKTIHIGVILFPTYQLLDAAGTIDYINTHSNAFFSLLRDHHPLTSVTTTIHWTYIAETLDPVQPSCGPPQLPTHTFANPPPDDQLDYLVVPGPDPTIILSPACVKFFQTTFPKLEALLTICTGSLALAQTGILDGHKVCSNKFALNEVAKAGLLRKEVTWIGDRRWIVDGKIWSGAGVTAGIDLAAEFARVHFDKEVVQFVKEIVEYTPRPDRPDEWAKLLDGVDLS